MPDLSVIGFDADDTLWHHERFFELTTARFEELLRPYADPHHLREHLTAAERRNVKHYGFGVKGFTLSMIETAVEITEGRVPGTVIGELIEAGRQMLRHPIEALPHVAATLEALAATHKLIVITKGDLIDQERKVAASGLGPYFSAVEIGNSLASDVVPALAAGAWGVHAPSPYNWILDRHDGPLVAPRFREVADVAEVIPLIAEIET